MIPLFKPWFDEEEMKSLQGPFETGWIGLGPKVAEFERAFAAYIGTAHAVGVNSGTAALHLALKLMGVEGREVITTPLTFVSTNHAILYNDGVPVFCDIEEDTLNIDADRIEALVTDKTAAIVVVHYGGHACRMDEILEIARRHHLRVVEDCAHASGGRYRGRRLGSLGDAGCFSFHAVKNLTTGEGGMVTVSEGAWAERLGRLRWLGITRGTWSRDQGKGYSWEYDCEEVGFKCHMHDISAALGLVQLGKLDAANARRSEIVATYSRELGGLGWLEPPVVKDYAQSAHHNYVIKTDWRDALNEHLRERGIASGVHYIPNHFYRMYQGCRADVPVCERVWKRLLTLPLFPGLTDDQLGYIIDAIKGFQPGRAG